MSNPGGFNKIFLRDDDMHPDEGPLASAPALPGMNLVLTNAARVHERDTYAPGATPTGAAGATAVARVAKVVREDSLQGKTIDDAYVVGENVMFGIPQSGGIALVLVASGQTIAKGNVGWAIASGKWNGGATSPNAVCEFLEGSGGALAADTHLKVRFF